MKWVLGFLADGDIRQEPAILTGGVAVAVRCGPRLFALLLLALWPSPVSAQRHDYEALADWNSLCEAKTWITAGIATSYDRDGGNNDYNWYEWPEGFQDPEEQEVESIPTRIVTLTGPGIITRFHMPHADADEAFTVRLTIDGTVRIDTNSDAFLDGSYLGALYGDASGKSPLVRTLVGGQVSYEPIAFQESLVIESNNFWYVPPTPWAKCHHYYQYNYHLFPSGTVVTPYDGSLTPEQQDARPDVISMVDRVGSNPAGPSATAAVLEIPGQSIPVGGSLTLADLTGGGRVRRLNLSMPAATDDELDGLRLRVRYDDRIEYAIDVPVSHFFGAGHERAPYASLPLGTEGPDGFYSYWPMPYRDRLVVELANTTGATVAMDGAAVEYESTVLPSDRCYLHAAYGEEITSAGQAYHHILDATGAGHYVGSLLYLTRDGTSRGILEGDDIIVVDGDHVLYGSGLEDAYNGGYYYNHVIDQNDDGDVPNPESGTGPFSGILHMDDEDFGDTSFRSDQYRWLIPDYVPFTESVSVLIENHGKGANVLFGSTAFYYLMPEPATLVWTGAVDNAWDLAETANWSRTGSPGTFWQGDHVTVDDTAGGGLVTLADTVAPGSVLVDNDAVDYVLTGPGALAGPCGLTKRGSETLTIATANAYTGGTFIKAGTVVVASDGALGEGIVELGDTTGSNDAALLVDGPFTVDNAIVVQDDGSSTSTRTLGGTGTSAAAVFSGDVTLGKDLLLTAEPGGEVRFDGAIANADHHTLIKVGGGTVILEGFQTHGPGSLLEVQDGLLVLNSDASGTGLMEDAHLSVLVADATLNFGCDQHLDTLDIGDGGKVVFAGANVVVVRHLVISGVDLGGMTLTPEPATGTLLLAGLALVAQRLRRRRG